LFAFFPAESSALDLIDCTRDAASLGSVARPDSLEWFDLPSLRLIARAMPEFGIPERAEVALFIEQAIIEQTTHEQTTPHSSATRDSDLDRHWLELLERCGALVDLPGGVRVAQTAQQHEELRRVRHAVPTGVNERAARNGMPKLGTDLSVADEDLRAVVALYHRAAAQPLKLLDESALRELLEELGAGIDPEAPIAQAVLHSAGLPDSLEAVTFGHVADNHLHVNFFPRDPASLALARYVYAHLTRVVIEMGGSPSAEHGIGKIKRAALRQRIGVSGLDEMLAVKRALDPHGCLAPGNLFEVRDVVSRTSNLRSGG
jgi:D-lactate dehydrogenase (cytochrome)